MKKLLALLLIVVLCFAMAACGPKEEPAPEGDVPVEGDMGDMEIQLQKDAEVVGMMLDLGDAADADFAAVGATAGKTFKDGTVEVYVFDVESEEYKAIEAGTSDVVGTCNNGMVLVAEDAALVDAFKALTFM